MNQEKIGKYIAKKRKEKNLTQEALAEKLGITFKAVSKWECGKGLPDPSLFKPLCEILNISVNDLLSGEDENKDNGVINYLKYQKSNYRKKSIIGILISLFIIIFLVLLVYFVNNYNNIKVYKLYGESDNFSYISGMFIETKEKYFYVYGDVVSRKENIKEENIKKISLKYEDNIIFSDGYDNRFTGGYTSERYGYNEMFSENVVNNINNWYIEVTYTLNKEERVEKIYLNNELELVNNNFFEKKVDPISSETSEEEKDAYKEHLNKISNRIDRLKYLLDNKGYKKEEHSNGLTIYFKTFDDDKTLSVWIRGDESPYTATINLYDGPYFIDYSIDGQFLSIKTQDIPSIQYAYYERKDDELMCVDDKAPSDIYEMAKSYIDLFDREFDGVIPPKDEWGTLNCGSDENI